jgi:hypothetical protein
MAPRDAELIEVAPGRWRDPALCSQQDLEAAQALGLCPQAVHGVADCRSVSLLRDTQVIGCGGQGPARKRKLVLLPD